MGVRRPHALAAAAARTALLAAVVGLGFDGNAAQEGSVRLGDAVSGLVRGSDLVRIKRQLDLEDFSIVAAARLGALAGREAVLVEPFDPATRDRVKAACAKGSFCPERLDFAGSRLRVILLQDSDVLTILTIDREARGAMGRLFEAKTIVSGAPGQENRGAGDGGATEWIGWTGWAEAASGHVGLVLTPIVSGPDGKIAAGRSGPVRIRWNDRAGRFQIYDCAVAPAGAEDTADCAFLDEIGE